MCVENNMVEKLQVGIAGIVIIVGAFAAFLIKVPKEQLTQEHHVVAEG